MGTDCKSVAKATKVRTLHPPPTHRTAPASDSLTRGRFSLSRRRRRCYRPDRAPALADRGPRGRPRACPRRCAASRSRVARAHRGRRCSAGPGRRHDRDGSGPRSDHPQLPPRPPSRRRSIGRRGARRRRNLSRPVGDRHLQRRPDRVRRRRPGRLGAGRCSEAAYHADGVGAFDRPKYGGLNLAGHPDGASPRFGSCHVRLRPAVNHRATFTVGDTAFGPTDLGTIDAFAGVLAGLLERAAETGATLGLPGTDPMALLGSLATRPVRGQFGCAGWPRARRLHRGAGARADPILSSMLRRLWSIRALRAAERLNYCAPRPIDSIFPSNGTEGSGLLPMRYLSISVDRRFHR